MAREIRVCVNIQDILTSSMIFIYWVIQRSSKTSGNWIMSWRGVASINVYSVSLCVWSQSWKPLIFGSWFPLWLRPVLSVVLHYWFFSRLFQPETCQLDYKPLKGRVCSLNFFFFISLKYLVEYLVSNINTYLIIDWTAEPGIVEEVTEEWERWAEPWALHPVGANHQSHQRGGP